MRAGLERVRTDMSLHKEPGMQGIRCDYGIVARGTRAGGVLLAVAMLLAACASAAAAR